MGVDQRLRLDPGERLDADWAADRHEGAIEAVLAQLARAAGRRLRGEVDDVRLLSGAEQDREPVHPGRAKTESHPQWRRRPAHSGATSSSAHT